MSQISRFLRFSLLVPFLSLSAFIANATTMTSASCTLAGVAITSSGPTTATCMSVPGVYADAQASESIGTQSAQIVVSAEAAASSLTLLSPATSSPTTYSVAAQASEALALATTGPARAGFIQFSFDVANVHAGEADTLISDGVHQFSLQSSPGGCQLHACVMTGTEAFNLGSVFDILTNASTMLSGDLALNNFAAGSGMSTTTFSLFESDGKTPVSFSMVPEPSAIASLLVGLLILTWHVRRKRLAIDWGQTWGKRGKRGTA